ncbi:MAG TPA: Rieske 2Fe-2S domain-containing protein [Chloroflexota bacterium]
MALNEREEFVRVGPGTLAGRVLRHFWQPVHRAEDLAPAQALPRRMLGEDFTLYRGEGGKAHAVAFRCAHRGTQLSTGWVEGDCIRCFYHGWKYDASGQCVEQPAEDAGFAAKIRIKSYPVAEHLGLIFVYFGDGTPPPLPRFPEMEDEHQGILDTYTYTWPCSYFNALENDAFHGIWVHRDAYVRSGRTGIPIVEVEETEYGFVTRARRPGATHWPASQTHFLMPNAIRATRTAPELGKDAWREALTWRVAVDDEHFATYGVNLTHVTGEARDHYLANTHEKARREESQTPPETLAERVLRGEIRIEDIASLEGDYGRLFNVQDYVAQVGQGTFACLNDEHLGREDAEVIMLRKLYRREMRALAEGRPLTQWTHSQPLSVRV